MNKTNYLFVYGTLLSNFTVDSAKFLRENATLVGKAHIHGLLFDLGNYPGAVYLPHSNFSIKGEVYEIKKERFNKVFYELDNYEGLDPINEKQNEYIKDFVVANVEGKEMTVITYLYQQSCNKLKLIDCGFYPEYMTKN
ncbi:gamma-glutamylcyclotransferase [Zhouia sp. PK063]|uniref:gamma-glutamylcyclotransferase n=1 Tax=Zhouia sp. PK063 TaxID=3373602 RepID=UPI0037880334